MWKRLSVLSLLILANVALADSTNTSTGERVIENAISNGDMKMKVRVGSTATDAITITGSTGAVTAPVSFSTPTITGMTTALTVAQGGTGGTTATTGFNNLSPMTTAGDLIYGGASGTRTRLAAGTSTQLLHSGTTPSWSAVSLTADVSGTLPIANGGTNGITAAAGFDNLSPMTTAGDTIYGGTAGTRTRLAAGTSTQVLHSGTTPSWSALSLTADVSGVLPLANGGSNKNATAVNGGLVWSDSDSFEITAAGTSQQWVLSGGAGTPTMSNTTTTGKFVDGSADEIQMRVQGHSTQTSTILSVEKSDATSLLAVTNVNGTKIRGTTTNDSAASGFVGEFLEQKNTSFASTGASNSFTTIASLSLTAGDWEVGGGLELKRNGATFTATLIGVGIGNTNNSATSLSTPINYYEQQDVIPTTFTFYDFPAPTTRVLCDGTNITVNGSTVTGTTVYLINRTATYSAGTPQYTSYIYARRTR